MGYCFAQKTMTRATGRPGGPWGTPAFVSMDFCRDHGILVEACSPVAHGETLKSPEVRDMAKRYGVSVPKPRIRYDLQLNTLSLPKTANLRHMADNAGVDFEILAEDMERLKTIKPLKNYSEYSYFPAFSRKSQERHTTYRVVVKQ